MFASAREQGKLPAAKAFKLAERDKHMSEQKTNYMAELDAWTNQAIFALLEADGFGAGAEIALQIRKAIRAKVLESFKNGIKAGSRPQPTGARKETKHAQAQAR
jgi:hypothetical protein